VNQTGPDKCFVVMPFGTKPLRDGSSRLYDFDKIYRVVMQRAIRLAGLEPIRTDERKGANLIHTDMFKDLRELLIGRISKMLCVGHGHKPHAPALAPGGSSSSTQAVMKQPRRVKR
jgi:hypothetical protein